MAPRCPEPAPYEVVQEVMDADGIRTILVRGTNWVGDAVMTTPAVAAIRRNFPHARISLLVVPWVMDVFKYNPNVDEIIPYQREDRHKGLRGKMTLIRELKERNFDLAILLQNAFEAAFLTWRARIPRRAGYNTDARAMLLTHAVKMRPEYKRVHQTQYYLTMLKGLGLNAQDTGLLLEVPEELSSLVHGRLKEIHGGASGPLVVMAPGATYGSAKMWPLERYSLLARKITKELHARVIVLGSAREKSMCDRIVTSAGGGPIVNLSGTTGILEAASWIRAAELFISNDSGLMHVAAALSKPQAAIFGPTDRVTTGPKNPKARLIYHETSCAPCLKQRCPTDHRCMDRVTTEEVFAAVKEMLEENAA